MSSPDGTISQAVPAADLPLHASPPPGLDQHPLFKGQSAILSGDAPRFPSVPGGHEALLAELKARGIRHEPTVGQYGGQAERAVIAYGVNRDQAVDLGKRFGQEAIISANGPDRELVYTNGPRLGASHPAMTRFGFGPEAPPDDFLHIPGKGYARFYFDQDRLKPPPGQQLTLGTEHMGKSLPHAPGVAATRVIPWAGSYPKHDGHPSHARRTLGPGVLVPGDAQELLSDLAKAEIQALRKDVGDLGGGQAHDTNDQAAKVGTSGAWAQMSAPYGSTDKSGPPADLRHYPLHGKLPAVEALVAHHGYTPYLAGGKHGRPDLTNRNYQHKALMIWDPSPQSGGDFGERDYTHAWRLSHELAHALTLPALNAKYGEGRRMGALGKHRTLREAKRAVEWEHMVGHKQRELLGSIGVHVPDHVFNREMNTVMGDAVHRAITGKFVEPAEEGFRPHPHAVPLEVAHRQIDQAARSMGLQGDHDLVRKSEAVVKSDIAAIQHGVSTALGVVKPLVVPALHHVIHTVAGIRARASGRRPQTPQSPGEPNVDESQ